MRYILSISIFLLSLSSFGKNNKWEIACQAYTFKEFTLSETLEKLENLDIHYVELYKKQKMSPTDDRVTDFRMSNDQIKDLKALLKKHNVKATSYGVVNGKNKTEWIRIFEFAKTMDIETIATEPHFKQLAMIDSLSVKYKIKIAIHNHPEPTKYWNPEIVQKALENRSKNIGVCADLGHWTRSGLDATKCLQKLEGRIFEIHTKDVNKTDKTGHAVVIGEGIIDWDEVFAELKRQSFKGKLVIEHETSWDNPVPDMKKNVKFLDNKSNSK